MANYDYSEVIKEAYKGIEKLFKNSKAWEQEDGKIVELYSILKTAVWQQVHAVLVPQKTEKAEKEIRDILAKYVIGYTEKKRGVNFIGALSPIRAKLVQMSKTKKARNEYLARYLELYDDFMALASFRSMKHYFLYMQKVFGFTLWEDTQNCFEGYWYYGGRMVLDGEVKFIEKQCGTGYGKSISDAFMQSFIFGIDIDNDVLKVCGNDKFTDDCFQNVLKLMLSHNYAKVFPYYAQFECDQNLMFQFCARKDLKFAITGSKKSTNLRIVTKLSDVNGVRAKYLFLDDITQRKDMANLNQHNKDIHAFTHEWFERNYNRNFFYIVASGTTYSQFDLLSHLKRVMGGEKAVRSPINKYTYISKSDYIIPNGTSVFVCVPVLDYDTDQSTYPKKIPTASARKKREENPTEFYAMDQQRPMPPDSSPFYFTKLRQYTTLPPIGECGRLETCVAALDTKRRGKDYLSMPIFFEADDPERKNESVFYLKDWLYDDRPMKECIPLVVAKIIQHNITRLYVERNTEECIETLLQDRLKEQGYTACVIEEVYSTEPKDRRIMTAEGDIKAKLIFPEYNMYSQSSDMGKALLNVYGYRYDGKVAHDDAPDSLALFVKRFVMGARRRNGSIQVLRL
jgi:predicted phage terminase large subunit-like protein